MTVSRTALCAVYAVIALAAFIGTWGHNVAYFGGGLIDANLRFWQDTVVNPASTSITIDLLFLALAVSLWMLLEARRLSIRFVWLYVLAGILVAISVAFPVFMIQRERALARRGEPLAQTGLGAFDMVALALLGFAFTAFTAWTLLAAIYR